MNERVRPHVNLTHYSPNYESRGGAHPTLIVVHATVSHNRPGLTDLRSVGDYFALESTQASSHVCTDNAGHSARYVNDLMKAWHVAAFNPMSLGIEQILPADGSEITPDLYRETARWVAWWSRGHGIPIRVGEVDGYVVTKSGVLSHKALGMPGGGHVDPGPGYDLGHVLALARYYRKKLR